jgi:LAO/AO transport system kinase
MVEAAALLAGDILGVAKALSVVERGGPEAEELLTGLRGRVGRARTVGITGAPGVGKSTLVQSLGTALLRRGERVAVLAVDPSSPFSGGALLGDRVRMPDFLAAGGFVRSMATRGALGGLAVAASDALDVLDAAGFEWVLLETVGVGQDEVDVAGEVETVVVVTVAGLGDDVQAAKAGVMEIADVFAVNKADRPGVEAQVAAIEGMLALAPPAAWRPPVVRTTATTGEGVEDLLAAVLEHQRFLDGGQRRQEARRRRARRRVERLLSALIQERMRTGHRVALAAALAEVGEGAVDPYTAARRLLDGFCKERP